MIVEKMNRLIHEMLWPIVDDLYQFFESNDEIYIVHHHTVLEEIFLDIQCEYNIQAMRIVLEMSM